MWYVYSYLREDKTPYYIGKGSGKRCYSKHRRSNGGFSAPEKERVLILKKFNSEKHKEYMREYYKKRKLESNNGDE